VLGAILAPTDPVLASALQPQEGSEAQPVSFTLAAEGALNDGASYPFVILGLAVAGVIDRPLREWALVDFAWGHRGVGSASASLSARSWAGPS
jgi:NhaP-type Na+/H+ or K+/H+ antiporter